MFISPFGNIHAYAASLTEQKEQLEQQIAETDKKLDNLKSQENSKEQYLKELNTKLDLVQDKTKTLSQQIQDIKTNIAYLDKEINSNTEKVEQLKQQVSDNEQEVDQLKDKLDQSYYNYAQRMRAMYISGGTSISLVEMLLESNSMSDMLTRMQMIKSLSKYDGELLSELINEKETLDNKIQSLLNDRKNISDMLAELQQQKETLITQQTSLEQTQQDLNNSEAEYEKLESETNAEIKELNKNQQIYGEYRTNMEKELAEIDNAIAAADQKYPEKEEPSNSSDSSSGGNSSSSNYLDLTYPCPAYTTITCAFGAYSGHTGCDFSTHGNENQKIVAAESGTVILVKNLNYSYGHYIVIRHDKKTSSGQTAYTLYAHNNKIIVSEGQHVNRGQQIAYSGSTGNSTGPHCHFELRVGGSSQRYAVNPASWF